VYESTNNLFEYNSGIGMQSLKYEHLIDLVFRQVRTRQDDIALVNYDTQGRWQHISWRRLGTIIEYLSQHLLDHELDIGDRVAIFSDNRLQWSCADLATLAMRGVVVPIYATSTADQVKFILKDAQAQIIFVDHQEHYDLLCSVLTEDLHNVHVIVFDSYVKLTSPHHQYFDKIVDQSVTLSSLYYQRLQQKGLTDLATLIYTSGTTGNPKGVMLDHMNFSSSIAQHKPFVQFSPGQTSLAFLPLSHVFERSWTFYVLARGGRNVYLAHPMQVQSAMAQVQPHVFCVVPRFLEKIYSTIHDKVKYAPLTKRLLFKWALYIAKTCRYAKRTDYYKRLKLLIAKRLVLMPMRKKIAPQLTLMPCGGAALDEQVAHFFYDMGLPVVTGYGMTETTATITCQRLHQQVAGSCGTQLEGVAVKIGQNNEILIKGDTVMRGYYNNPEATQEVLQDGWLKTGDAGYINEQGELYITERIKDLMKTSNGKYIAPQRVEGLLSRSPFVEQVAIIADARHYVSALIVPAFSALEDWAKEQGIHYRSQLDLVKNSQVNKQIEASLAQLQKELARFEQVKKFTLLSKAFSIELGEITPTLKLRRKVIYQKYALQIASMYN
tara:strand:- start:4358 stop:6181 length:1824 start_codon:yes stop_codon:yes gene_type:complete